jgi:hypothetical protein
MAFFSSVFRVTVQVLARVACTLFLALLVLLECEASAHASCETPPTVAEDVVVHVRAREHTTLGFVYGAPDVVVLPYRTIEVDRPGATDLDIVDAAGVHHHAVVYASSAARGVAIARTNEPIAKAPLAPRAAETGASECRFSVHHEARRDHPEESNGPHWIFRDYEASVAALRERAHNRKADEELPPVPFDRVPRTDAGSPVVDEHGALRGMIGIRGFTGELVAEDGPLTIELDAIDSLLRVPEESPPARPSVILYGGIAGEADFSAHGGLWGGASYSLAARYRDLAELRVDAAAVFLLPTAAGYKQCPEPPCLAGVRGVVTPSIGPRIELAHDAEWPVVLTPTMGVAMGFQYASGGAAGGPMADVNAPNTFLMAAPGATLGIGPIEVRARVRLPHLDTRDATYEVGLGFSF